MAHGRQRYRPKGKDHVPDGFFHVPIHKGRGRTQDDAGKQFRIPLAQSICFIDPIEKLLNH